MCLNCAHKALDPLKEMYQAAGFMSAAGIFFVCVAGHGDHIHLRFKDSDGNHVSPWHSLPATLPLLDALLPRSEFSVHLHSRIEEAMHGIDAEVASELEKTSHTFSQVRVSDGMCQICFDSMDQSSQDTVLTLPCGHAFHTACSQRWLQRSRMCPSCRYELTSESIHAAKVKIDTFSEQQESLSASETASANNPLNASQTRTSWTRFLRQKSLRQSENGSTGGHREALEPNSESK